MALLAEAAALRVITPGHSISTSAQDCSRKGLRSLSCGYGHVSTLSTSGSRLTLSHRLPALKLTSRGHKLRLGASCELPSFADTPAVPVKTEQGSAPAIPASPGIYAVYSSDGVVQYVGLTRRLSTSIQAHVDDLPELCASVKVAVVTATDRSALTDAWKVWMEEIISVSGGVPPGNEAGNTTWTSRKPRRMKADIRLTPGAHVQLTVPLEELLSKVVKECEVVAFIKGTRTSPQCGFSHRVLTLLNEQRVDYETLNVLDEDHNPGVREAIKAFSQWPTIPQVFIKGEFVGGADILEEMVQTGELKKLLSK